MSRVLVGGVGFDPVSQMEAVIRVVEFFAKNESSSQKFFLTTPNPEMILATRTDSDFKEILNSSDLVVADGIGILWASYFLSLPNRNLWTLLTSLSAIIFRPSRIRSRIPARVTGSDLFPKLLEAAADENQKVFLLGAAPGVAETVRQKFEKEISGLEIVGTFAGSPGIEDENEIRSKIDESGATMLFVAFGAPAQEKWIKRNLLKLQTIKFAAGIGGTFDFYAGKISRAPKLFCVLGLEWLWRLIRQPSRAGRIWNATFRFVRLIWQQR